MLNVKSLSRALRKMSVDQENEDDCSCQEASSFTPVSDVAESCECDLHIEQLFDFSFTLQHCIVDVIHRDFILFLVLSYRGEAQKLPTFSRSRVSHSERPRLKRSHSESDLYEVQQKSSVTMSLPEFLKRTYKKARTAFRSTEQKENVNSNANALEIKDTRVFEVSVRTVMLLYLTSFFLPSPIIFFYVFNCSAWSWAPNPSNRMKLGPQVTPWIQQDVQVV